MSATGARVRAASRRFFRLFLDAGREAASETQLAITIAELDRGNAAQASGGPQSRVLVERELSPGVHFTVLEDDERVLALFRPGGSVRIEPKRRLARCETEPEALDRWPGLPRVMLERALLELMGEHSWFGLHAAGVVWEDRAALLCGGGATGKTTASLTLVAAGFACLGDDKVLLHDAGSEVTVGALSDEVGVCASSVPLLPAAVRAAMKGFATSDPKVWVPLHAIAPSRQALVARPAALFFPEVSGASPTDAHPLSTREAMQRLTRYGLATCSSGSAGRFLNAAAALLEQARPFGLRLDTDMRQLPALVRRAIDLSQ